MDFCNNTTKIKYAQTPITCIEICDTLHKPYSNNSKHYYFDKHFLSKQDNSCAFGS